MLCLVGENVMKWVKLLETNWDGRKGLEKKLSEWKIAMIRFEKKLGVGENGAFHLKLNVWSLEHEVRNETEEGIKFLNNYS